jgi:hypothetical protein
LNANSAPALAALPPVTDGSMLARLLCGETHS